MAVACGDGFTAAVTERGEIWACGTGDLGQLGLGTDAYQLLSACVGRADKVFDVEAVVMVYCSVLQCVAVCCSVLQCVAARDAHVACVTAVWTVWSWGKGSSGPFGHGDRDPS